ncbi:MAG: hypothetical protein KC593_12670 [Myxococcales bacterium]|nr:hypothetical protein [Myxococcales bacterium]MCB9628613.1 hypothetical protein [Sandaracinaceae bacterium]
MHPSRFPLRRPRRALGLSLLLACAALLPGCTVESMTVELGWGSALSTCFDAGVTRMDYTLYDSVGIVRSGTNVTCGDLIFSSIAIDNYELDVRGYDRFGSETYAATCTGMYFDGVDITHRCTVPPTGDPLLVEVRWDLSQTASFVAGTCAEAGVFDYDVLLRNSVGTVVSSSVETACVGSGVLVLDFGVQPPGSYSLEVTGYADDGFAYWFGNCGVSPSAFGQSRCDARDDP